MEKRPMFAIKKYGDIVGYTPNENLAEQIVDRINRQECNDSAAYCYKELLFIFSTIEDYGVCEKRTKAIDAWNKLTSEDRESLGLNREAVFGD